MDTEVLKQLQEQFPHKQTLFEQLAILEADKLWHEITLKLSELIHDEQIVKQPQAFLSLYNNFVKKFANKLDQLHLANFLTFAAAAFPTNKEREEFLGVGRSNLSEETAKDILELEQISYRLTAENREKNDIDLATLKGRIEKQNEPLGYSFLYRVRYQFFLQTQDLELTYLNALQYLAYTKAQDIPTEKQQEISVNMAVAILASPTIYNFSELLQQPVVKSLENSLFSWLFELIKTFNSGSVDKFNQDIQNFSQQIAANPLLSYRSQLLEEKIRIMAFLELVFNLPKNDRTISFAKIAEKTHQTTGDVELLLMRSMALGLVKGSIDQVEGNVTIKWMIPRILDSSRVQVMKDKFEEWTSGLKKLIALVETQPILIY